MSTADLLRDCETFEHFTDEQLEALAACLAKTRYPADVTILQQGDRTFDAYLIDEGVVTIRRQTPYGHYTLGDLGPGELFGETAFVDRRARSGDAVTREATQLVGFHPVTLAPLLDSDPRLAVALYWTFWKSLSDKLRRTNERLEEFFSRGGPPDDVAPEPTEESAGEDFRLDLPSKRKVFEEQRLSGLEINFLTSLSKERKLAAGEVIFREGDRGDAMYVVLDGKVMISKNIPGAGEEALAFLERGDYFGEMSLIDKKPRSADARADEGGAVVLAIPGDVLSGILDIGKVSSLRLLKILCSLVAKRLRELDDKLVGWFILAGGGGTEERPPQPPK